MTQQQSLYFLSDNVHDLPDASLALTDPDGLVAVGGDLSTERLIFLYRHGFFPWYNRPDPILWWHPSKRCILQPKLFHASRSLKKSIRQFKGDIRVNSDFHQVIQNCSDQRKHQEGTWISDEIIKAFTILHQQGYAHSIEVWLDNRLVGGLYGVAMGEVFFGESMFSTLNNASKYALCALCRAAPLLNIRLIDCQIESKHIMSLGAEVIPRQSFINNLTSVIPQAIENKQLQITKKLSLI